MRVCVVLLTAILVAGCTAPTTESSTTPTSTSTSSTSHRTGTPTSPAPLSAFPAGIYYSQPSAPGTEGPNKLVRVGGNLTRDFDLRPNGYELTPTLAVSTDSQSTLVLLHPEGTELRIPVRGLYHIGRPTLSPDATKLAVQANESPDRLGNETGADFNIYVVDVKTGSWQRISQSAVNEESPEWVPHTSMVAYSSFDPAKGVDAHFFDLATNKEREVPLKVPGGLHLAATKEPKYLLEAKHLRVYDVFSGALRFDLRSQALTGLQTAGYSVDTTHDGMQHQGSFPLDGDFSPDGTQIVFDGAVTGKGEGLLVMQIDLDGSGFKVLAGPIPVDPARSNNDNYSQLNPKWI